MGLRGRCVGCGRGGGRGGGRWQSDDVTHYEVLVSEVERHTDVVEHIAGGDDVLTQGEPTERCRHTYKQVSDSQTHEYLTKKQ